MAEALEQHIASSFVALADLLDGSGAWWDAPSMCEGWRVREVVAHVTMAARYDEAAFMAMLQEDGFDFTRLSNRVAAADAQLPEATLLANLRDPAQHSWTPPGGGQPGALNHIVIHGLDATGANDLPPVASETALRIVLDQLTSGGVGAEFGVDVSDVSLRATDIDWSFGTGSAGVLSATAGDLVLHLAGRRLPADRFSTP
jgi:uncharacterized protein (TIGR03083 family)